MSEAKRVAEPVETPALFKAKKERSPSYPGYDLEQCLDRAKQFYSFAKRNVARTTDASKHWGFSEKSSGGRITLAAMLKFGLLDEEGRGEDRGVRLSDLALHILLDEQPDSPERLALVKRAALLPSIHTHLWDKYGADLPGDAILRTYLKRDMKYTDGAVDDLISEYKATIAFAKLKAGDKIGDRAETPSGASKVNVGDWVQWVSGGIEMFPDPLPVLGFSPDRKYAFVSGTDTGIPVEELIVVERAMTDIDKKPSPPPNPFADTPAPRPRSASGSASGLRDRAAAPPEEEWGVPPLRFPLPRGNVIEIRLKAKVTQKEFDKLKKLFELSAFAFIEDDDEPSKMDDDKTDAKVG